MQARMKNPAIVLPDAMQPIQHLIKAAMGAGVPQETMELVHLRASQINGCSACVWSGAQTATQAGIDPVKLAAVAAWREAPCFTDAERAALELAECATRLSDRTEPVPDEIWNEVADHFSEEQLAAIVLWIAVTNLFNRLNAATKQVAGAAW